MQRPQPFVLVSTDTGPMIASRLDFAQSPHGYFGVGYQLLHTGAYDADEIALVREILDRLRSERGDGVVAVDCGANIGVHTLAMAKHMVGWGEVIACEAQERLYYALVGNIALNNAFNARAMLTAVGRESGTLRVPQPNYLRSGSLGSLELQYRERTEFIGQPISYEDRDLVEVSQVTLDSLALPRVDFIKIDVEGMELDVLEGARSTIERDHPTLLIEWIKCGLAPLRDFLIPLGYAIQELGMNVLAEHT